MKTFPSIFLTAACSFLVVACQTAQVNSVSTFGDGSASEKTFSSFSSTPKAYAVSNAAGVDDLVDAALKHHPSLNVTRARITALEQAAVQARSLPDPSASVTAGSLAETAAGQVTGIVGVQQKIPYPGKRKSRSLALLKQAEAMRAQLKADELALADRVRKAYWDYYVSKRTVSVVSESKGLLTTLRGSVEARIAANKAKQQDLLKLDNEITRLDQRLAMANGREKAAKASLNALLYRPGGSSLPTPKASGVPHYGSPSTLLSRAQKNHPSVRASLARIEAAKHGITLAKLKKRPDFTAGLAYAPVSSDGIAPSANGDDQFMAPLGLTLPIWGEKNRAAENEAAANLAAEEQVLATIRASLQQQIESSRATFDAEQTNLALYSGRLIPDARQSFDLFVTGYSTDESSFLDVIDAWRQLLDYQLAREENRARLGKAEATLRFAAGLP